eukprot:g17734.t1
MEEDFLECMMDDFLDQYVEEPTREQAVLDWVLYTEKELISNLVVQDPLGKNDHNMVEFFIKLESDKVKYDSNVLNFKKTNFDAMRLALARISWPRTLK